MKVHHLKFQAIGPFTGLVEIPFENFAASGLFLLEGPTGAGKSTIIDAIVFALYGELAGTKTTGFSADARLRSGLVGPEVESFVELTFSTSRGVYRVRRTPKQDRVAGRKTKDGTGVTESKETVLLTQLLRPEDTVGTAVATKPAEANIELRDNIVRLTRDQFVRVMVLPQGEFTAFLEMETDARADLLEKLFGASLYSEWQDYLRKSANAAQANVNAAQAKVIDELNQFVAHAAIAVDARKLAGDAAAVEALLSATEASVARAAEESADSRADAASIADRASAELRNAERALTLRARRTALLDEQAELEARATAVADDRLRLAAARNALPVLGAVRDSQTAEQSRAAAERALGEHQLAIAIDELEADATVAQLQARADGLLERITQNTPLAELEAGLDARRTRVLAEQERLESAATAVEAGRQSLDDRERQITALAEERTEIAKDADKRENAAELVRQLSEAVDSLRSANALDARAAALESDATALREQLAGATADMRSAAVAVIVADMQDGDACPVCGSHEYATHASSTAGDADAAAFTSAQHLRDDLRDRITATEVEAQAARADALRRRTALPGQDEEQAHSALVAANDALALAKAASQRVTSIDDELDRVRPLPADYQQQADRAAEYAEHRARVAADTRAVEADEKRVAEAKEAASVASIEALVQSLQAERGHVLRRRELVQDAQDAATAASNAARALEGLLATQGFVSVAAVRDAELAPDSIDALAELIASYEDAVSRVQHDLAAEDLVTLDLATVFDVPALTATAAHAATVLEAAEHALGIARQRVESTAAAAGRVREAQHRASAAAQDVRALLRVSELANGAGDNVDGLKLRTYALQRRFDEVLEAANLRLSEIAGGRYQLQLRENKIGQQRIAGLDISVSDSTMDEARHTKSLSGGEKFFVSLALALGLASVVQAEQGGIAMDTLFVDEGFGSLDSERLDEVMQVLRSLAAGDRLVGVVSHVAEMKERIFERITVERVGNGVSRATANV